MGTGISFAEADVTAPNGTTYEKVSVTTRDGVLLIRQGETVVARVDGVTSVRRQNRKRWVVAFAPGEDAWQVLRTNCGCG